jgi:hypothetical protein
MQAAGRAWRRSSWGLYVPTDVEQRVEQRILEAGTRLCTGGAVTGWAALRWRGAQFFDGVGVDGDPLPVTLVLAGSKLRPSPGCSITQAQLGAREWEDVDGLPCATVQRALFDELRCMPSRRERIVAAEMAFAAGLISPRLMRIYVSKRQAWTGVGRVRECLESAREGPRSPQESRMIRVWEEDALLPVPLSNPPVFDLTGGLLGYPDLFDPVAGVVGEYDGEDHRPTSRRRRDVVREERFRDHGLEYITVVGGDLRDRGLVARRMLSTRARARFLPPAARAWTLDPPAWFPVPESLDARLGRLGLASRLCAA